MPNVPLSILTVSGTCFHCTFQYGCFYVRSKELLTGQVLSYKAAACLLLCFCCAKKTSSRPRMFIEWGLE